MPVITIPKKLIEDDLVVIPKREYEEFTKWRKNVKVRLDERWFWTSQWQEKEAEAETAIRSGRIYGPFSDHRKLLAALKPKRKTK